MIMAVPMSVCRGADGCFTVASTLGMLFSAAYIIYKGNSVLSAGQYRAGNTPKAAIPLSACRLLVLQ
jgi:hypothetical protein